MVHPMIVGICSLVVFELMVWASQVALVVKNLPANAGNERGQVQSLDGEDPLEEGMATQSSILICRIPWTEEPAITWWVTVHGVSRSQTRQSVSTYTQWPHSVT